MNRANRAAQFQPFDALKGLKEALKAKEEKMSRVEKRGLTEEQQEALSIIICRIEKGTEIEITFFFKGHYITITDKVIRVSEVYKYIELGSEKIFFDDIYEIKIIG